MLHFQKLDVYRCSIEFLVLARRLRATLPRGHSELADQLRRAAQSVPQNIAEGAGKTTPADKSKFYAIARGSANEAAAHLDVMLAEQLIEPDEHERAVALLARIAAMLTRLVEL